MAHPLGHLNLLAILSSLLLLTLAAAYACLLCIGKKKPPDRLLEKRKPQPVPAFPGGTTHPRL